MRVIKFEQKDAVGHIVLDNPPKNLIASDFSNSLKQAVHEASESDIRALLVRAEGPNFSQGGDVLDFLEKNADQFRTFIADEIPKSVVDYALSSSSSAFASLRSAVSKPSVNQP